MSNSNYEYNKLINVADKFKQSMGLSVCVLDFAGEVYYDNNNMRTSCMCCVNFKSSNKCEFDCAGVLKYGKIESEKNGGKFTYFCPSGLAFFASSVLHDNQVVATLACGPISFEPNDELPVHSHQEVEQFSEVLFMTAMQVSDSDSKNILHEKNSTFLKTTLNGMYSDNLKLVHEKNLYPINKEKQLMSAIETGDRKKAKEFINDIFSQIVLTSNGNINVIKTRANELFVLISRAAINGGAEIQYIFEINNALYEQLFTKNSIDEITNWFAVAIEKYISNVFDFTDVKHFDTIFKAIEYIKANYSRKITLEEVADNVYLSPTYFSKIFNDEMGCSFNQYLNNLRIEKSKNFLLTSDMTLFEIANAVGYEDQSYFSKIFKKLVEVTPGKFKSRRGLSE